MNFFGRIVLPLIARPHYVAVARRALSPRLFAQLRRVALWGSTVGEGHHRLIFKPQERHGRAPYRGPVENQDYFSTVLGLNEAYAARIEHDDPLERLMRDVFSSLPNIDFPLGAQKAFASLRLGRTLPEAIAAARDRGIADADINMALHAYLLLSLPSVDRGKEYETLCPLELATRLLNQTDFLARRTKTNVPHSLK